MISVIVPIYNIEKHLKRCIDSIINQSLREIEIILINDGSTDMSGEICDKYANNDRRIKVLHDKNNGVSAARNAGINIASGKYITFVDSDDFVEKNMLELMYKDLEYTQTDMICYNRYYVDNNCKSYIVNSIYKGIYYKENINGIIQNIVDYKNSTQMFHSSIWSKIYLKKILETHNISFSEGIKIGEDTLFVVKYLLHCNSLYCNTKPVYHYYQHNEATTKKNKNIDELWKEYKDYLQILESIITNSNTSTDLTKAVNSLFLKSMNSTTSREANKNSKTYLDKRRNILRTLNDVGYKNKLKKIKFMDLSFIKKTFYIQQKSYLVDLLIIKHFFKNVIKRTIQKLILS